MEFNNIIYFTDPVFCPHLLPPKAALTLKCILQHQPWHTNYTLSLDETEHNADIVKAVNEQLMMIDW